MSRKEGKAGLGGGFAFEPAFETGCFQFANVSLIFQCVKCDKICMTQPREAQFDIMGKKAMCTIYH